MPQSPHAQSEPLDVAGAYDRWSGQYDNYDNPMVAAACMALEARFTDVAGLDVVEFGCGTGRNLDFLRNRGAATLTGLDLSAGMLAQARLRDGSFNLIRHDVSQPVPLPDISADLVLFCLTLEHLAGLDGPLNEARRLLRRHGRVFVVEIHPFLSQQGVVAHFRDAQGEVRISAFPHRFSDFLSAFTAAGLHVTDCREWHTRDLATRSAARHLPAKLHKRGPDAPWIVAFEAEVRG